MNKSGEREEGREEIKYQYSTSLKSIDKHNSSNMEYVDRQDGLVGKKNLS